MFWPSSGRRKPWLSNVRIREVFLDSKFWIINERILYCRASQKQKIKAITVIKITLRSAEIVHKGRRPKYNIKKNWIKNHIYKFFIAMESGKEKTIWNLRTRQKKNTKKV